MPLTLEIQEMQTPATPFCHIVLWRHKEVTGWRLVGVSWRLEKIFCSCPNPLAAVRVLAFEPRKGNNKGAENGKLFAILSGAGNNYIVCSKSCGVPPSHVMTTGTHPIATPGELSSILY